MSSGRSWSWSPATSRWRRYRSEFEACKRFLGKLTCGDVVVAMGNHDARNIDYRHFDDFFGARDSVKTVPCSEGRRRWSRSTPQPDLDEGEVGREHYSWLDAGLRGWRHWV